MKAPNTCQACGDRAVEVTIPNGLVVWTCTNWCADCAKEKLGYMPKVTDAVAAPSGTGTVKRQQEKRKTTGG
jgi:hypothetical protein